MLIGLMSDTHDRVEAMALAVEALRGRGAEFYIHCGDVGSERVLDHLAGLRAAFVWGNCDYDRMGLQRYAQSLGIACYGVFGALELGGKRAALLHGDDPKAKQQVVTSQEYDYLFQGHTHIREDLKVGRTRIINPGALHRANPKTCALLDIQSDVLEYITIG